MSGARLPYPGLRSFAREEADLFFGRDGCIDDMVDRLAATRFLAVLGASGSGKSSLVRTGLLDALELGLHPTAGSRWIFAEFHPGRSPIRGLAAALMATQTPSPDPADVELLAGFLRRGPRSVEEWYGDSGLAPNNLLLVVDQFEELFRYGDYGQREEAESFVALLLESAASRQASIHVVITMRSEYLGACALIPRLVEQINPGLYLTPRMDRQQCRDAIEGPAGVGGFVVEPALVNRLLNDMASFAPWEDERGVDQLARLSRRADQLPLMQHILNRLWLRASNGEPPVVLTEADYDAVGGLNGALDSHGAEIMAQLGEPRAAQTERIFRALVAGASLSTAVRRPCRFADLAAQSGGTTQDAREIVDAFRAAGCNFLQPPQTVPLDDDTIVDISHESLIRQWSLLAGWFAKEVEAGGVWVRLTSAAQRHRDGVGALLHGLDLDNLWEWWNRANPGKVWAERYGGQFEDTECFLAASKQQSDAEQARTEAAAAAEAEAARKAELKKADSRRLRQFAIIGGCSLVVVGGLVTYLLIQLSQASQAKAFTQALLTTTTCYSETTQSAPSGANANSGGGSHEQRSSVTATAQPTAAECRSALAALPKLALSRHDLPFADADKAFINIVVAAEHIGANDPKQAVQIIDSAQPILQSRDPKEDKSIDSHIALSLDDKAAFLDKSGERDQAMQTYEQAIARLDLPAHADDPTYLRIGGLLHHDFGLMAETNKDYSTAATEFNLSLDQRQSYLKSIASNDASDDPDVDAAKRAVATSSIDIGFLELSYDGSAFHSDALSRFAQCSTIMQAIAQRSSTIDNVWTEGLCDYNKGLAFRNADDAGSANQAFIAALLPLRTVYDDTNTARANDADADDDMDYADTLAGTLSRISNYYDALGEPKNRPIVPQQIKLALKYRDEQVSVLRDAYALLQRPLLRTDLIEALGQRTWLLLLDRQPQAVLADAAEALKLDPKQDWIAINEAHADLFLGRFDDAKQIYLARKDNPGINFKTNLGDLLADYALFKRSNMAPADLDRMQALLTGGEKAAAAPN